MSSKSISAAVLWAVLMLLAAANPPILFAQAAGREPGNVQESGGGAEVHLGKAYEAMRNERYDDAAREFRSALVIDPTLVMRARFPLAVALFEQRNYPASRAEFEKVRQEAGEQPGLFYYLGRIDQEQRDYKHDADQRYYNSRVY